MRKERKAGRARPETVTFPLSLFLFSFAVSLATPIWQTTGRKGRGGLIQTAWQPVVGAGDAGRGYVG